MNVLKYRVSLDMFDTHSQTTIKAKKGDSACQIYITLAKKGRLYDIGEGCSATFNARKSDGNFIYDNCTIENNTIVYDFTSSVDENGVCQVSACEGIVECEVTLYSADGKQLTSPRFTLFVDETVYNGEEIASTPQSDFFKEIVAEAVNGKQDFFALVSGENNDKILTFMGGATIGTSGDISINSGGRTYIGAQTGEPLILYGDRIEIHGEIQAFRDIDFPYGNGKITNLVTPNGTDPTQAANVEFVVNERRMRLIMEHTMTAEDSTNGTTYKWDKDMNGKPFNLDAVFIYFDIPTATKKTRNFSVYLNNSTVTTNCLFHERAETGSVGSAWVSAEKITPDFWRTLRSKINGNPYSRAMYTSYNLIGIDTIHAIRVGMPEADIKITIWGRDAI